MKRTHPVCLGCCGALLACLYLTCALLVRPLYLSFRIASTRGRLRRAPACLADTSTGNRGLTCLGLAWGSLARFVYLTCACERQPRVDLDSLARARTGARTRAGRGSRSCRCGGGRGTAGAGLRLRGRGRAAAVAGAAAVAVAGTGASAASAGARARAPATRPRAAGSGAAARARVRSVARGWWRSRLPSAYTSFSRISFGVRRWPWARCTTSLPRRNVSRRCGSAALFSLAALERGAVERLKRCAMQR